MTLTEADIARIAAGVLDLSHPYTEWTHGRAFRAALWLLAPSRRAARARRDGAVIRRYNEAVGVPNSATRGYHATITEASLRATAQALAEAGAGPRSRRSSPRCSPRRSASRAGCSRTGASRG
jgi:hypothetical protein